MSGRLRAPALLSLACLAGAVMLIASQFGTLFNVNAAGDTICDRVTAIDQHHLALVMLGALALAAVIVTMASGSKPAATAVAVSGAVALLLFLLIDLPDAGRTETVNNDECVFATAEAKPVLTFWVEMVGALVLAICGAALATLSSEQLGAIRQRRERQRPTTAAPRTSSPQPEASKEAGREAGRTHRERPPTVREPRRPR